MEFKDITVHSYPLLISQSRNWGTPLLLHPVSNKAHNLLVKMIFMEVNFIFTSYNIFGVEVLLIEVSAPTKESIEVQAENENYYYKDLA